MDTFTTDGEKSPQDDYVVVELHKHLTHAQCPMCNGIHPIKSFKRRLTLQETAKKLGKDRANSRMVVDSKYCVSCRKKAIPRKTLKRKTRDEIKVAVMYGDIHPVVAKLEIAKRDEEIHLKQSAGMKNHWARIRQAEAKQYSKQLQAQVNRKASYYHANKHNGADTTLIALAEADYRFSRLAKQTLLREQSLGEKPPQTTKLEDAYTYDQRQELMRLKAQIPATILNKQRRRKA